jgi:hypothetical protein
LTISELEKSRVLTTQRLKTTIETIPSGLAALYESILRDLVKGCLDEAEVSLVWRIIAWVVRAARPMTISELRSAIAIDLQDICFKQTKQRMVRNIEYEVQRIPFLEIFNATARPNDISQLLSPIEVKDDAPQITMTRFSTVRLIHQSAKEYLHQYLNHLEDLGHRNELRLPKFGHTDMAGLCVTFLRFNDFNTKLLRTSGDLSAPLSGILNKFECYDLLEYAISFWDYHLRQVEPDEELMALVCSFLCDAHDKLRFWNQVSTILTYGQLINYTAHCSDLHIATALGIVSVIKHLIKRGDDVNALDSVKRTPLFIASRRGRTDIAQILLDAGASPSYGLQNSLSDLQYAVLTTNYDTIRGLLNDGVDINAVDENGRSLIFYGCASGDLTVLTMLLNAGATLVVTDRFRRAPLDVALRMEYRLPIAKQIASMGIDCEAGQELLCHRNQTVNFFHKLECDSCGRILSCYFYRSLGPHLGKQCPIANYRCRLL